MSRGQVTRALYRFAGSPDVTILAPHGFSDVPAWADDAVRWLVDPCPSPRRATGYPDGSYRPNASITRGDLTRMLFRTYGYS